MLGVTLRLARGTAGRLLAAGLAIALGAAFVAAVLLATGLLQRTTYDQVASGYAGADAVLDVPFEAPLDEGAVDDLGSLPGSRGAVGAPDAILELSAAGRTTYAELATTTSAEPFASLEPAVPEEGALPSATGEIALSTGIADELEVAVGQSVVARTYADAPDASSAAEVEPTDTTLTVVALLPSASTLSFGSSLVIPEQARVWVTPGAPDTALRSTQVLVAAAPGTSPEELAATVSDAVPGAESVRTADAASQDAVDDLSGGQDVITGVLLAFAVLAVFVAGVVITNTFAVLVAQRTRQLALLRCVGATAGQVRGGILAEATLLGLAASLVGTAAGTGLAAAAAAVLARTTDAVSSGVVITPASVLLPLVLGTAATVLAALAPARAATRVAPLAALRPPAPVDVRTRGSLPRLVAAALLVLGGGAALAAGLVISGSGGGATAPLLLALAGGAVSFLGVLVGAVFVVPSLVGGIGRLVAGAGGAAGRLSVANAVRNPRRTTTTTSALLIGVTLVSLVVVGAASTQRTLASTLDSSFPVDAEVGSGQSPPSTVGPEVGESPDQPTALPSGARDAVTDADGVRTVAPLRGATVLTDAPKGRFAVPVRGIDPDEAGRVLAVPDEAARLVAGTALVPEGVARSLDLEDGQDLVLADGDRRLTATVAITPVDAGTVLLTPGDLEGLAPQAPLSALWVRLDDGADAAASIDAVRTAVADVSAPTDGAAADAVPVSGSAVERAAYDRVITVLLSVVVGLLAVAVLIALIGVANTLSLSVIERTRESALLRALGLTRGQLRGMLAVEGALIAGVGALVGVVLGVGYGWSGTVVLLGAVGDVKLDLPWGSLLAVLVIAVLAGLLASVLPGRRAARTPAAAALGE